VGDSANGLTHRRKLLYSNHCRTRNTNVKTVDIIKWIATAIQLMGYALTGLNIVPWNIFAFVVGIVLRFLVGVMWKDRAIMVVHIGAFIAILGGYLSS
jgi:hypothetical protein